MPAGGIRLLPARHYYYHYDGLGSVVALTHSDGNTAEQYTYDVYGAVLIRDADGRPLAVGLLANRCFFTARRFYALTCCF